MTDRDDIAERVLTLSAADRIYVLGILEQSLEKDGFANDEVAAAWVAESVNRIAAYERDESKAEDGQLALDRIRSRLVARRNSNPL